MKVNERIKSLQQEMIKNGMDVYYIPTSDFHQSEYVGDYFKVREYMSGFTGSVGTLIVTHQEANLWVDGRYFAQADRELTGTSIRVQKMGQPKVPTIMEYLLETLQEGGVLGFDGAVVCAETMSKFKAELKAKKIKFKTKDLTEHLWENRPTLPSGECFLLADKYVGLSMEKKIAIVKEEIKKKNQDAILLSSLEDVAWTFNLRGADIAHTPVVLSYALISKNKTILFIDKKKLSSTIINKFKSAKVMIKPYFAIEKELKETQLQSIIIDPNSLSTQLRQAINTKCKVIEEASMLLMHRAVKNKVELKNLRNSHIKDGVALTKFIYWIKNNIGKKEIDELSAAKKLEELRAQQPDFIEPSFSSIVAYGPNAAMMHYSASETNYTIVKKEGFLLVDSGGQYFDGTTDVTRTITLGQLTEEAKTYYTAVLRGMIRLSKAKFLFGCTGSDLDMLARGPVWDLDIDYQCGTGHGVGFCLGVHEGPQSIRWGVSKVKLEEGMILTNEPGVYLPGNLGIRIENELIVQKGKQNYYGQFMNFETITMAPIDLDAVNPKEMLDDEIQFLNDYHEEVYKKISPYLTPAEKKWLNHETRKIVK